LTSACRFRCVVIAAHPKHRPPLLLYRWLRLDRTGSTTDCVCYPAVSSSAAADAVLVLLCFSAAHADDSLQHLSRSLHLAGFTLVEAKAHARPQASAHRNSSRRCRRSERRPRGMRGVRGATPTCHQFQLPTRSCSKIASTTWRSGCASLKTSWRKSKQPLRQKRMLPH